MENQNPTPPIIDTADSNPPVIPEPQNQNPVKSTNKFSIKLILGIFILILLAGSIAGYFYKDQILKLLVPVPRVNLTEKKSLNPNTGSLYKDVAQRLEEELK